jgi:hypothetical protein
MMLVKDKKLTIESALSLIAQGKTVEEIHAIANAGSSAKVVKGPEVAAYTPPAEAEETAVPRRPQAVRCRFWIIVCRRITLG